LVVEGDSEPKEEEDFLLEPDISLHAITGLTMSQTVQVKAKVIGILVLILINSSRNHSFVSPTLAAHLTTFIGWKQGF